MRKLAVTAIALGTFIAGGLLGYGIAREFFLTNNLVYEMASIEHMNTYVMIQRFQGTPQAYATALHDFLVIS